MVRALRYLALAGGLFFVVCETWGTGEFLHRDQGGWNYVSIGGCAVTAFAGILPIFAMQALHAGRKIVAAGCWLALPLAIAFIFAAAIQRTGSSTDGAQQERQRADRAMTMAERTEAEATAALPAARAAALAECQSGRGRRCLEAESKVAAAEARIDEARRVLSSAAAPQDDPMARRIVSIFPGLTQEQVRLYLPLILPALISWLSALLLAFGAHVPAPSESDEARMREFMRRLAWDANAPEKIDMGDGRYILKSDLRKAVGDGLI